MKKSLIIIPLLALFLSACQSSGGRHSGGGGDGGNTGGLPVLACYDFGPDEANGYRRITTKPVEDKEYVLGFYHAKDGKFFYMNGHHHTDENGQYPYYQSTSEDVSKAVKVVCHYAADKTHFSIQIKGGGEYQTYDGKYLKIYEGTKSAGEKITSIDHIDNAIEQYVYEDVSYHFRVQSLVAEIETERIANNRGYFACSGPKYYTVSGIDQKDLNYSYICHLFEKI